MYHCPSSWVSSCPHSSASGPVLLECPSTSLSASSCTCSKTVCFPWWFALWPMLHLLYNISSCLSSHRVCWLCLFIVFVSCSNSPAALAIKSLDSNAVSFSLLLTCIHFNFSISLFFLPCQHKATLGRLQLLICSLASKLALYNLPKLSQGSEDIQKPESGNLNDLDLV